VSPSAGIPFTAVRPWNLYGPGQRIDDGRVPVAFMRMAMSGEAIRLHSDGTPRRSPCFVWDGLLQLAACLDPVGSASGPANIGNPSDEVSVIDLARRCAEQAGLPLAHVHAAPPGTRAGIVRSAPDIERVQARAATPLPPLTPLSEGLSLLADWVAWSLADG
jgi:UDP-glucuronate decarboxylase